MVDNNIDWAQAADMSHPALEPREVPDGPAHEPSPDSSISGAEVDLTTPLRLHALSGDNSQLVVSKAFLDTRSLANPSNPRASNSRIKLLKATRVSEPQSGPSVFNDSRDIVHQAAEDNEAETTPVEQSISFRKYQKDGPQGPTRRSARIQEIFQPKPKPALTLVKKRKRSPGKVVHPQGQRLRRSARLAGPLTEFHKYLDLPPELRLIIWEQAIIPRPVYIRNVLAPAYTDTVQTPQPQWFGCDDKSAKIAKCYKKRFSLPGPNYGRTSQWVDTDADIIVLEPCCNGCRGLHCTIYQFEPADRASVRFLAMQIDSPHLASFARPCWETVSQAFTSVETLYLLKEALKGDQFMGNKALLRSREGEHEEWLRTRFDEWKRGAGTGTRLNKLQFVVVVDVNSRNASKPKSALDRYKKVPECAYFPNPNPRISGPCLDWIIG